MDPKPDPPVLTTQRLSMPLWRNNNWHNQKSSSMLRSLSFHIHAIWIQRRSGTALNRPIVPMALPPVLLCAASSFTCKNILMNQWVAGSQVSIMLPSTLKIPVYPPSRELQHHSLVQTSTWSRSETFGWTEWQKRIKTNMFLITGGSDNALRSGSKMKKGVKSNVFLSTGGNCSGTKLKKITQTNDRDTPAWMGTGGSKTLIKRGQKTSTTKTPIAVKCQKKEQREQGD